MSSSKEDRIDINGRDGFGRTVLHLVAYSLDPNALDYLRLLLETQPKSGINLNLQDVESGWTALHRALWVGNLAAARILLAEDKIDASVKDFEGLTCWDLYNSTVEGVSHILHAFGPSVELRGEVMSSIRPRGRNRRAHHEPLASTHSLALQTNPPEDTAVGDVRTVSTHHSRDPVLTCHILPLQTLYTWGANRNQTLGHGEGNDRSLPDKVNLTRIEKPDYVPVGEEEERRKERGDRRRFDGVSIREVRMAKLHTGPSTQAHAPEAD